MESGGCLLRGSSLLTGEQSRVRDNSLTEKNQAGHFVIRTHEACSHGSDVMRKVTEKEENQPAPGRPRAP